MSIKKRLSNWLLPSLINSVDIHDLITVTKEGLYLGSYKIEESELRSLQEEIKFVERTRLWSILTNTLAFKALERIGEKSLTYDDVWSGKMMLFNIELQKEIMKVIKNYK